MRQDFYRYDSVVCVSNSVLRDYSERMENIKNTKVLYNILDVGDIVEKAKESIDEYDINNDAPVVVSCGRLSKSKGFDDLIIISKKLLNEGIRHYLLIIGDGEEYDNLKRQVDGDGLTKRFFVKFNGNARQQLRQPVIAMLSFPQ